jgi:hypothetical protein
MGVGMVIFLLFIALIIYIYYYLKQKFGSITSAINSLNPINAVGNSINSAGNSIGDSVKSIF